MEKRNLDGVYFRMKRHGKWDNVCFSDLTEKEMHEVMENRNNEWFISMIEILTNVAKDMGNVFNDDPNQDALKETCVRLGYAIRGIGDFSGLAKE